jgi:hypothetical protein
MFSEMSNPNIFCFNKNQLEFTLGVIKLEVSENLETKKSDFAFMLPIAKSKQKVFEERDAFNFLNINGFGSKEYILESLKIFLKNLAD